MAILLCNCMKFLLFIASIYIAYKALKTFQVLRLFFYQQSPRHRPQNHSSSTTTTTDTNEKVYKAEYRIIGEKD